MPATRVPDSADDGLTRGAQRPMMKPVNAPFRRRSDAPRRLAGDKSRQTPHMVPAGGAATAAGVRVARGGAPAGPSPRGGVSYRRELGRLEASVKRTPLAGVGRASFIFNVRYTDGGSGASAAPNTLSDPPHARAAGALERPNGRPVGFRVARGQYGAYSGVGRLGGRGPTRWTGHERPSQPASPRRPSHAQDRSIRWGVPFCRTAQRTHLAPEPGPQRRQGPR